MNLILAEELLLLAQDDETGKAVGSSIDLECGLAGAVLVELALAGRVDIVDDRVIVVDRTPVGEPVLDQALEQMASERKGRHPDWWVEKLRSGLRDRLLSHLTDEGILRMEQHKVFGLFPVRRYPAVASGPEAAARLRLDQVVLHGRDPDARTAALAALVDACGLTRRVFPDADQSHLKARMGQLSEGQWTSAAVRKAIRSIQAGVVAASTAASVAASAGSCSTSAPSC